MTAPLGAPEIRDRRGPEPAGRSPAGRDRYPAAGDRSAGWDTAARGRLVPGTATGGDPLVVVGAGHEQAVRWRDGERLEQLFEHRCDWMRDNGEGDHLAVDAGGVTLTYGQLDAQANRLARYLLRLGARPGDRIGLLFDQAVPAYVGMLAVLKVNAAYVPLDPGFPDDRVSYIVQDAGVRTVLTLSHLRHRLERAAATAVCVDEAAPLVAAEDGGRLTEAEKGTAVDELCYVVYTSGSTGRPKGVAIEHASICNFVRTAVEVYGIEASDRVYQGMTIAFDFSVEEIWVPLLAGATLVPKPAGGSLVGQELWEFLDANRVTALCCVPTLLATLDHDLPGLGFLLVSGEACPADLVARWHKPGRRFLNVYGPTEATVTATWTPVEPGRPVTIGVPLPTYSVVILDPAEAKALPPGELGEIGIAGVGLASGYVNRDDLTERAFIPDFLGIGNNPSGRIYRTGDLGRVNADGQIEYHGRIDTQVKIRGYRIELTEIESVLLRLPGIAQAVVGTHEREPGVVELVAYYSLRGDSDSVDPELVGEQLRRQLPAYMVPAYLEPLAAIPMLPSDKADRKRLPPPNGRRRLAAQRANAAPATDTERIVADELGQVLGMDQVPVDRHFFDDMGANSLLMARFCASVRKRGDLPPVSMRDVYLHPTVRDLAAALGDPAPAPGGARAAAPTEPAALTGTSRTSTSRYVLCGALQLLLFLASSCLAAVVLVGGYRWISAGTGLIDTYVRSLALACVSFLGWTTMPILAKWLLVGRWRPREIPVWSLAYVRFWVVKLLIRANPMVVFVGSPLYTVYLRALGARIGRGVAIFSRTVPVCTDLLTIGDGTVIRKGSSFTCYRAHAGVIQIGRVTIGRDAFVGEATVIDIDAAVGDGAQLGHSSSLHSFQEVPAGERWHGSPAQPTGTDYRRVAPTRCGAVRRAVYSVLQLLNLLVLIGPVGTAVPVELLTEVPRLASLLLPGPLAFTSWTFYRDVAAVSFALFFGGVLGGLAVVVTVPRLLNLALQPDKVYPLYGFHYGLQRLIARMTNGAFTTLFGDSSYIVNYLQAIGYHLAPVEQTGSNFGMALVHETPFLSTVGTGTMVSDGLSIMNADFSSTSFRVSRATIGARNFLGNAINYPSGARTGDNCLLATKAMVPIDGEPREDVGLLGSPCFEIPRSVQRDRAFDHLKTGDELRRRLNAKNRYNLVTMGLYLLVRWLYAFGVAVLALAAVDLYDRFGVLVVAADMVLILGFTVGYYVLVERAVMRFRSLRPRFCSIYDPYFWWHERFWKVPATAYIRAFDGTPFKSAVWRLLGVRIGRRVFDDGCWVTERTLVAIGDDCTLNALSGFQSHSLEDGTFKSDHISIGDGCTLGVNAFIHYGVTMGDGAVLGPDSFLMKGEEVPPHAHWRGNPATAATGAGASGTTEELPTGAGRRGRSRRR
jgi:non-ribosomal peptide synthetase-like protein